MPARKPRKAPPKGNKTITAYTTVRPGDSITDWPDSVTLWPFPEDAEREAVGKFDVVKLQLRVTRATLVRS